MAMRGPLETMGGLGFEIRDPQRFASNMARLMQETGKAAMALAAPHATGLPNAALAEDIVPIAKTFAQVQQFWLTRPMKVLAAQTRLWQSYADLWNASFQQMVGAERSEVAPSNPKDSRFKDPAWSESQYFDVMRQAYLITSHWAENLIEDVDGLEPETQQKARFYIKQIVNAIAPSNWVFTNP